MDTAIARPQHREPGPVVLYFTKPWTGGFVARVIEWFMASVIGHPTHVTASVSGLAFVLAPGGTGCFQVDERLYQFTVENGGGMVETAVITVPDAKGALDAAYTYGVGPITGIQTVRRFLTGHQERDDIDCVLAACKILRGGGLDIPDFRTPKGLLLWLKARPLSSTS